MWVGISVLIWGVVLGIAVLAMLALSFRAVVAPGSLHLKPFLSGFQYVYLAYLIVGLFLGFGLFLYIPIADYFGLPLLLAGGSLTVTLAFVMVIALALTVVMYIFCLITPWSRKESLVFSFAGKTIIVWAILFLPWVWIQGIEALEWTDPKKYEVVDFQFTKSTPGLVDLLILLAGGGILSIIACLLVGILAAFSLALCFPLSRPLFGLTLMNQSVMAASIYYVLFMGGGCAIIWYFVWPDLVEYYGGPYAWLNQYL